MEISVAESCSENKKLKRYGVGCDRGRGQSGLSNLGSGHPLLYQTRLTNETYAPVAAVSVFDSDVFRRLGDDTHTIHRLEFTCRTFREYAKDLTFYTHIRVICNDYIGDAALSTLIDRATPFRSLHVVLPKIQPNPPVFDGPFPMDIHVFSDSFMKTFRGTSDSLESLVLHNLEVSRDRDRAVCKVLSSCPKLKHVEIVNCFGG
ncbi:hypothetical protein OROMI_012509 [Orobanche minor]